MFNFNWSEIILILLIAIIVIGPKDIPKIMRFLGYWVGKIRQVTRVFSAQFYAYTHKLDLDNFDQIPTRTELEQKAAEDKKDAA